MRLDPVSVYTKDFYWLLIGSAVYKYEVEPVQVGGKHLPLSGRRLHLEELDLVLVVDGERDQHVLVQAFFQRKSSGDLERVVLL